MQFLLNVCLPAGSAGSAAGITRTTSELNSYSKKHKIIRALQK
ncbi:MAG: hypothetical protein RL497_2594 [Pseudomonadota bacterium]|jgi:hypothetical protein